MNETLLERSARYIETGQDEGLSSTNPVDASVHEVADGVAVVCGFSHVWALDSGEGLVLFDTSLERHAERIVAGLRSWSSEPVATIVYTHGHVDHVGGAKALLADAADRGDAVPDIVSHEAVKDRFHRYRATQGYNTVINSRQFGWDSPFPVDHAEPTTTFTETHDVQVGDLHVELRHDLGETDDHAWGWAPELRAVLSGDFLTWVFPNAGNPQKVQRYPLEWSAALRSMAGLEPDLLLPAHGLPIEGSERIATVLDDVATALEGLVGDTIEMMNAGATLDEIVHSVDVPARLLDRPYLRPIYDEPEFVVRNTWRLYGGWYDGNPARLKPARDAEVADEVVGLAGGAERLAARAVELADQGQLRLACQLAEWAGLAAPSDPVVHGSRADVYRRRRDDELSLMAKGIFGTAAAHSQERSQDR